MLRLETLRITLGSFALSADLTLPEGSLCAVMGPSGSGKSTLLSAIAGFVTPDAGRILWRDRDLVLLAPGHRPVGMIFQDNNLFPHLTAAQNVALGIKPGRLSSQQHASVATALGQVGLPDRLDAKPAALSGGQQSRVAVARILVQDRPILLLDEPFSALGPGMKDDMIAMMRNLARRNGLTVLMVTHDPQDAQNLGGETIFVHDGQAQPPRPTDDILADPPSALADYLRRS